MNKKKLNIDLKQEINSGDKSFNVIFGGDLNLIYDGKGFEQALDIVIPVEVTDMIYKGVANNWNNIIEFYKTKKKKENLSSEELLRLIVSYDIGRVRKLEDANQEVFFLDTSWLSHNYAHWNRNVDMTRWLVGLTEVSVLREKRDLQTSRVFFWNPEDVKTQETLLEIIKTISAHLACGIKVYLAEKTDEVTPIDFQHFSKEDGVKSNDFTIYDFEQVQGISDNELATEIYSAVRENIRREKTVELSLDDSNLEIRRKILTKLNSQYFH